MDEAFGRPSAASSAVWRLRPGVRTAEAGVRADGGDLDGWAVRVASVTGVRHRLAGEGNDDAFAWRTATGATIVAVADGLGSVPGSATAAALAARAGVDADDPGTGVAAANVALAGSEGATTLVVARVESGGAVRVVRVGDSSAFVLTAGEWRELFAAGDDDVVSTATSALPAPDPRVEAVDDHLEAGSALILVTDGLANPLRDGPQTVAPALAEGLAGPPAPIALAALVDFSRQGCHDDRTLLGIWRRPEAATRSS